MANRGLDRIQTECAMDMIGSARVAVDENLGDIDVAFRVVPTLDGDLKLEANVTDLRREDPDMVLYVLADVGVSNAVILDGEPVDPRGLLE